MFIASAPVDAWLKSAEDRIPRKTYLYENRMFTNKMRCSIFGRERKG